MEAANSEHRETELWSLTDTTKGPETVKYWLNVTFGVKSDDTCYAQDRRETTARLEQELREKVAQKVAKALMKE